MTDTTDGEPDQEAHAQDGVPTQQQTSSEQVRRPLGGGDPGGNVYHYTSAAGLVGIVNSRRDADVSRRLTFFASDVLGMNDISELAFGLEIVREHAERLAQGGEQQEFFESWLPILEKYLGTPTLDTLRVAPRPCVCAVSFTSGDDLLSQWVTYGSGGGFAIGLAPETLRGATYTSSNIRTAEPKTFKCSLGRVYYGEDARAQSAEIPLFTSAGAQALAAVTGLQGMVSAFQALMTRVKDPQHRPAPAVVEHASAAMAISIAAWYKHDAFKPEQEWRLLVGGEVGVISPNCSVGTTHPSSARPGYGCCPTDP
ncbi:DUF2971 domain-containing protein [Tsukamurella soli]|uniref:DUF2971 domain-containing protein n=1 Tax=Tsukamurella soli TaxID=644556 RepID=UPI00361A57C5